jgi:HEAT repeat protein
MARPAHLVERLTRDCSVLFVFLAILLAGGCGHGPMDSRQNEVKNAIRDLSSDQGPDRRHAATVLEHLLPPADKAQGVDAEAIARLRALVTDDRDDHVRAAAIRTLGKTGDNRSWKIIVERATADEAQVRIEVLQALAGFDAGRSVPVLVQALADAEPTVRLIAASTLAGTEIGVREVVRRLGSNGVDQVALINGLENSSLPAASQVLLNGLTSTNAILRSAAIREAGAVRHRPAVPILADYLGKDRRTGFGEEDRKASAKSLVAIGGEEALVPVLMVAGGSGHWAAELLADRQEELRPILVAQAAMGTARRVPAQTLVYYLLRDPSEECVAPLADLATPDLHDFGKVCEYLRRRAPEELRVKVAARLRGALDCRHPRILEMVTAFGLVGKSGDGPDADAAWGLLKAALDEFNATKAAGFANPPKDGAKETPEQIKNRERFVGLRQLVCTAAHVCGQLRASAAAPIFAEFMRNEDLGFLPAGMAGALALGDDAGIEQVNKTLLTTKVNPWLIVNETCGARLMACRDPRILPGLVSMMQRGERSKIYEIIAANGTPEAAAILMAELANPAIPKENKKNNIAHLMAGLGASGRPLFIKAMVETPRPAKPGDPDLGWWSAEFLREQRNAAASDVLAALAGKRPTGAIAARFIHAMDLMDTPEALAAQTAWLTDPDSELAGMALHSLVRNRRTGALPCIRAARDAAASGPWRDRLDQAISDITAPVKEGSS